MTQALVEYRQPEELTLPDKTYLETELRAVRQFQALAQQLLTKDQDYGVIPGTGKPTLLKPGAEKIAKLLGLADHYEIIEKTEDWDRPLFRYLIRCQLVSVRSGVVVSESFGECNSMENRYRWRWVFESQLHGSKDGLVTRTINTKRGKTKQYRTENEDPYSQVNTLLKMAQKRALVGAALSAGRLSEVFTQDAEDLHATEEEPVIAHEPAPAPPEPIAQLPDDPQVYTDETIMAMESAGTLKELNRIVKGVPKGLPEELRQALANAYERNANAIKNQSADEELPY